MKNKKSDGPVWDPLVNTIGEVRCQNYMYMGEGISYKTPVYLYKHIHTRRYLNMDAEGGLYFYREKENQYTHLTIEEEFELLDEFKQFDADLLH